MAKVSEGTTKQLSTARTTSTAKAMRKEKKEERKAREMDKEKTRSQRRIRGSKATAGHVAKWEAQGERVLARLRASRGGSSEFF